MVIAAALLAACSSGSTGSAGSSSDVGASSSGSASTGSTDAPSADGFRVAFVSQIEGIPYFSAFHDGANEQAEELGVTYQQAGPAQVDATEQVRIFESLVQQKFDAIAVSSLDERSLDPVISKARKAGVTVITSDSDAPDSDRQLMVLQASDDGLAKAWVDQLVEAKGTKGEYGIVSGAADATNMKNWSAGIVAYQEKHYPDLKLVGGIRYTEDTATALSETQNLITGNPKLIGVLSLPASALPGVAQAVKNADKAGDIAVIGLGSPQATKSMFADGSVYSTVMWNVVDLGKLTVWAMDQLLRGNEIKASNDVPGIAEPVSYDAESKVLLLGPPMVFNAKNADEFTF